MRGDTVNAKREKLSDIADQIDKHLQRMQADTTRNISRGGGKIFWCPYARASGSRVFCTYVSYQGKSSLTREEATKYLSMLNDGFFGRHYEALRLAA